MVYGVYTVIAKMVNRIVEMAANFFIVIFRIQLNYFAANVQFKLHDKNNF